MTAVALESFVALQRFGLGARPGDLDAIKTDPRGAVLAEIAPRKALIDDPSLPDTISALETIRTIQMDRKAAKQAALKQWEDKMTSQKEQIDLLTRELDVLQREYQIRAAAMYADVGNRMRNSADWDKQDAQYKQQIADKQKALEDAKQKLEDLQEGARKAGVSASARE